MLAMVAGAGSQSSEHVQAAAPGERRLTADEFRSVIGHFVSGVTVITTSDDDSASEGLPLAYFRGAFGRLEPTQIEFMREALRARILGL